MLQRAALGLIVLAPILLPAPAACQEVAGSFDQLRVLGLVKQGDTVYVTDAYGQRAKGTIETISRDSLVLVTGTFTKASRTFPAATVQAIERGDSLLNGTLIGLGIGMGIALASPRWVCDLPDQECAAIAFGAIGLPALAGGAIIGAVADARMRRIVYHPSRAKGSAGLRLVPILSSGKKGLLASWQF